MTLAARRREVEMIRQESIYVGKQRGMFAQGPFRYSWFDVHFIHSMEPKVKVRVPSHAGQVDEVTRGFGRFQEQLLERIQVLNGLAFTRVKASSPVNRMLRFSLGTWLAAIPAHGRQHLAQARLIRQDARFPLNQAEST